MSVINDQPSSLTAEIQSNMMQQSVNNSNLRTNKRDLEIHTDNQILQQQIILMQNLLNKKDHFIEEINTEALKQVDAKDKEIYKLRQEIQRINQNMQQSGFSKQQYEKKIEEQRQEIEDITVHKLKVLCFTIEEQLKEQINLKQENENLTKTNAYLNEMLSRKQAEDAVQAEDDYDITDYLKENMAGSTISTTSQKDEMYSNLMKHKRLIKKYQFVLQEKNQAYFDEIERLNNIINEQQRKIKILSLAGENM